MQHAQHAEPAAGFLLTGDVARLLDVSPVTVRQWHRLGQLQAATTAGGVRLFSRAEVERFATERERARARMSQ